jgi:hypothetical protein
LIINLLNIGVEKSTIKSIAFVDQIDIICCKDKLSNL